MTIDTAKEITMRSLLTKFLQVLCACSALTPLAAFAHEEPTPLIDKVRVATARFLNINVALAEGFVPATPCVSGPDAGAMGVHLVFPARLDVIALDPAQPEALIYEPMASGAMRLVGVEFIVKQSVWEAGNPPPAVPNVDGNLMNLVGFPNRFGLPAFYELHVWAWEQNPKGSYADWNTNVTCSHQPDKSK